MFLMGEFVAWLDFAVFMYKTKTYLSITKKSQYMGS